MATTPPSISSTKLRVGILVWLLSWMPLPSLIVHIAHDHGALSTDKATSAAYTVLWGVQITIGLLGLWLAGKETLVIAKADGMKGLPKNLWRIVRHGTTIPITHTPKT